jgi:hypothetical protein
LKEEKENARQMDKNKVLDDIFNNDEFDILSVNQRFLMPVMQMKRLRLLWRNQ